MQLKCKRVPARVTQTPAVRLTSALRALLNSRRFLFFVIFVNTDMPTIITHAIVPIAVTMAVGGKTISRQLLAVGLVASMVPDLDVVSFRFGVPYAHDFGHRGFTHSIFFALVMGVVAVFSARHLRTSRSMAFWFVTICAASHGFLDMATNGGLGVEYFWPFSHERHFLPCRVIEVSPLSLRRVFSSAGLNVAISELLWVWLPVLGTAATILLTRRAMNRRQS